ncbi:MAG TPA: helix-turn-helix transcriptional regulator [Acidiferrobacterales bacterium]|jgi:transcriptional regulator with XRE-family HTH domain
MNHDHCPDNGDLRRLLARRMRMLRAMRGWSQEVLAELSGLHRNYIGHIERAEVNIGLENLSKIARAFGLPAYALLKDEGGLGCGDYPRVEESAAWYVADCA